MKKIKIFNLFILVFFSAKSVIGEIKGSISVFGISSVTKRDTLFMTEKERLNKGIILFNPVFLKDFEFEDGFQADAKADFFVLLDMENSTAPTVMPKEIYVDGLFLNTLQIRAGNFIVDYGTNSYFHPLNIVWFLPDFSEKFGEIVYGSEKLGFIGLPAFKTRYNLPLRKNLVGLSLEVTTVFQDFSKLSYNYYLPAIYLRLCNFNFNYIAGINEKRMTSQAISTFCMLPFDVMLFGDIVVKRKSHQKIIKDSTIISERTGWWCNGAVRLEYQTTEKILGNTIKFAFEFFRNSEGIETQEMEKTIGYLETLNHETRKNTISMLFPKEHTFHNYIHWLVNYTFIKWQTQIGYRITMSSKPFISEQVFEIGKQYRTAQILLTYSHPTGSKASRIGINPAFMVRFGVVLP